MITFLSVLIIIFIAIIIFFVYKQKKHQFIIYKKISDVKKLELELENCKNSVTKKENYNDVSGLLARMVHQSPNAIMIMDYDGNIQSINQGFTDMYEYTFSEFTKTLGKNYRHTSFSPDVEHRLETIRRTKKPFRYEALNITKSGKQLWTQTALVPILNDNYEITNLITIDTDIHQRVMKSDKLVMEMEQINNQIDIISKHSLQLDTEFRSLFQSINDLYNSLIQTDQILKVIKEISDRTRILGFNASIEASRAEEFGKGFKVITQELVDISGKTVDSISQINDILKPIKEKQDELLVNKNNSEGKIHEYKQLISLLKNEVLTIEASISEFKSMA